MSSALPLTSTQDRYSVAATLMCPGTRRFNLTVDQAGVIYQLGRGWPVPQWDTAEHPILPGNAGLERNCDAIRLRSLKTGVPATVSVSAFGEDEL